MGLPNGYRRLEYIQSGGTQFIDTGFKPNQDTRVLIKANFPFTSASSSLFGAREAQTTKNFSVTSYQNHYRNYYKSTETDLETSVAFSGPFILDKNKNIADFGGLKTVTDTYASFSCPVNMYLFALNNNGTAKFFSSSKIYYCKIYDNGTLVRDFIPCQTTSGDIGLWDDVNSVFYGNDGTGTFTAGPSSLNLPVNIGGTWKDANEVFVNIGGTWKTVEAAFVNIGGTWKELG